MPPGNHFELTTCHVTPHAATCAIAHYDKTYVIHKPEVHSILKRRQRETDAQPQATCIENLMKFGLWFLTGIWLIKTLNTPTGVNQE